MGLIKCTECGKEISDKATACPNCGCPVRSVNGWGGVQPVPDMQTQVPIKRKKGHGCLTTILVMLFFAVAFSLIVNNGVKNMEESTEESNDSLTAKYTDISGDDAKNIDTILSDCGITEVISFEHDDMLDNAHSDGETGYRLAVNKNVDNIILYINADKSVYSLSYNSYMLYENGAVVAVLQDYLMSTDEASDLMIKCQDKIKEVLKSPSTAKFPNILEWGFKKEKNIVIVQGYVDAQNSFGAEIRSTFQFTIDTDTNTIQSLIFDGQEMMQ